MHHVSVCRDDCFVCFRLLVFSYLNNRVFASLANGDVLIYERDSSKCSLKLADGFFERAFSGGGWNMSNPLTVSVGSTAMPVSKMVPNGEKLWCGCGNVIKVFNSHTLTTENSFVVNDSNKHITSIVLFGNGVWLSLQNSAIVKCYHASSFESLCEVNVAPAVTKMLTSKESSPPVIAI